MKPLQCLNAIKSVWRRFGGAMENGETKWGRV